MRRPPGQTLLIDADDTLWENNVYFEQAVASFISCLDHKTHTAEQVREHLDNVQRATIAKHGYGLRSFRSSLVQCLEQLTGAAVTPHRHTQIARFTQAIAEQEMELLPGVASTLAELAQRHRCILVTKGDDAEQRDKLRRSGLAAHFTAVEVLPEKHVDAYRELAHRHACERGSTWMIGNSPKSDINPALAAGLHAVFISHPSTWALEHEAIAVPPAGLSLIEFDSFSALTTVF